MSGVRSFLALELSAEVVAQLVRAGESVREAAPEWRAEKWVRPENLHITLSFLGNRARRELDAFTDALTFALKDQPPFTLALDGVRAVPAARRAAMLWATFREPPDAPATSLARRVDELAEGIGVASDDRGFTPHATLVRARRPRRLDSELLGRLNRDLEAAEISMSDPSVTLFASTLTPAGPVYERLAEWRLEAG